MIRQLLGVIVFRWLRCGVVRAGWHDCCAACQRQRAGVVQARALCLVLLGVHCYGNWARDRCSPLHLVLVC